VSAICPIETSLRTQVSCTLYRIPRVAKKHEVSGKTQVAILIRIPDRDIEPLESGSNADLDTKHWSEMEITKNKNP
jgi:hypothetical protein